MKKLLLHAGTVLLLFDISQAQFYGGQSGGLRAPTAFLLADRQISAELFGAGAASSLPGATSQAGLHLAFSFLDHFQLGLGGWSLNPGGHSEFAADLLIHPLGRSWRGFHAALGVRSLGSGPRQGLEYSPARVGSVVLENSDKDVPSPYLVISRRVGPRLEGSIGWGQGGFLGHGPLNGKALGFFGSGRLKLGRLSVMGEFDGRSLNAGTEARLHANLGLETGLYSIENARKGPHGIGRRPLWSVSLNYLFTLGKPGRGGSLSSLASGEMRLATSRTNQGLRLDPQGLNKRDLRKLGLDQIFIHVLRPKETAFQTLKLDLSKVKSWPINIAVKNPIPPGSVVYLRARRGQIESDPSSLTEITSSGETFLSLPLPPPAKAQGPVLARLGLRSSKTGAEGLSLDLETQPGTGSQPKGLLLFSNEGTGRFKPVNLRGDSGSPAFRFTGTAGRTLAFYAKALDAEGRQGPASPVVVIQP